MKLKVISCRTRDGLTFTFMILNANKDVVVTMGHSSTIVKRGSLEYNMISALAERSVTYIDGEEVQISGGNFFEDATVKAYQNMLGTDISFLTELHEMYLETKEMPRVDKTSQYTLSNKFGGK